MKTIMFLVTVSFTMFLFSPAMDAEPETRLLIRCDDIGMCHTVNMAAKKLIERKIPFSTSVMVACPWFKEAAQMLKAHPEVGVGVHLTLNSEWRDYRWGPVLGKEAVPSLVDKDGYFHISEAKFKAANPKMDEIEKELRAQIDRARDAGLRIDYLDYHMGTAVSTPELRKLVEKLAREYKVGLSTYFGEAYQNLWPVPPDKKLPTILETLDQIKPGSLNLLVIHLGMENPEMQALIDMNNPAEPLPVSQHRQAELDALLSGEFLKKVRQKNIRLTTYKEVVSLLGLKKMKAPIDGGM